MYTDDSEVNETGIILTAGRIFKRNWLLSSLDVKKTGIILTTGAVFQSKGLFFHLDVKEMAILLTSSAEATDPCVVQGSAAGKYASQLLKASCASYAKELATRTLCRWCIAYASFERLRHKR